MNERFLRYNCSRRTTTFWLAKFSGLFLTSQGRLVEAAEEQLRAAELSRSDYELSVAAASALRQADRRDEAEIWYRHAANLRPHEARSHTNLGAILHLNGKYKQAAAAYREALRLQPGDATTITNLHKLAAILAWPDEITQEDGTGRRSEDEGTMMRERRKTVRVLYDPARGGEKGRPLLTVTLPCTPRPPTGPIFLPIFVYISASLVTRAFTRDRLVSPAMICEE